MSKNRSIVIANRVFEKVPETQIPKIAQYSTLSDCYANPSSTKQRIYDDWREWFINSYPVYKFPDRSFRIASYNCQAFSLLITVDIPDICEYRFYITRDHNRVAIIDHE